MSFRPRLIAICLALTLLAACTTTPTTPPPPTSDLAATAENLAIRQTHIAATVTAIQLTLDAQASATLPPSSPTAIPPTETLAAPSPTIDPSATPVPASPTAPPPTVNAPTPTALAPVVISFTADRTQIDPGESITFTWETANATDIILIHAQPNGLLGNQGRANLPATGSVTITPDINTINTHSFYLSLTGPGGQVASQYIKVKFNCQLAWFFGSDPGFCATQNPETKTVIEQPFEGGFMLWIPYDTTTEIHALYNDGTIWTNFDTWTAADPESDPALVPPEGRYQPVRGFGKFWREQPGVRDKLGWALAPEQQYSTTYQTEFGGTDWKGWNTFIRVADGRVIHITGHYANYKWEYMTP